jgi:hypothetical protein
MVIYVRTDELGRINTWSTEQTYEFLRPVETDYDISKDISQFIVVDNKVQYIFEIPESPIIDYVMTTDCPVNNTLIRHVYWDGEEHEIDKYFTIYLLVLHFNQDGTRNKQFDKRTWTRADKGLMRDNPLVPGEMVDEYDLFRDMVNSLNMPQLIQLGIYAAEETLNHRLYEN